MNIRCRTCRQVNPATAANCARCGGRLAETVNIPVKRGILKSGLLKRIVVFVFACAFALTGFYLSLALSARPINYENRLAVDAAIQVLDDRGFTSEVRLLRYLTLFRSEDNWLNASIVKENAYAATNFPFEIMTLYPDFFAVPIDDTERAAILLHEAKHLEGLDEKEAYAFVWRNRTRLGWTKDKYRESVVWQDVRRQTRDHLPGLFACDFNEFGDCTP
jgi:hypothetical protein